MIKGIILIAFMVVIMVLMVTRKVPTLIAIPILAIGIAVIAGVPLTGEESIISTVIQSGAVKLAGSYTACLIATWMSCIMQRTGITENMIRKAAELGGDKTNIVAILLFLVICALSTVMSGLGAVIMMGTIAIPILISVGVEKFTAAAILLCAYGAGEHFGMVRATYFAEVFGLEVGQVYHFSVVVAITTGNVQTARGLRLRFQEQPISADMFQRETMHSGTLKRQNWHGNPLQTAWESV